MVTDKIWSCKLKRPDTLRSHRTIEAASKRAGDHGFVYNPVTSDVYQVFAMSDNTNRLYSTSKQPNECNTGGFDMRAAMAEFDIQTTPILDAKVKPAANNVPCPWCAGTKVTVVVSEIMSPLQFSARASCADCGGEEPSGSGVHDHKEDAEKEALKNWNERGGSS